jgi:quercetin dioxygenase-like cupin family protein
MLASAEKPDCKWVARELRAGEIVAGHSHKHGHLSVFFGDVTVTMGGGVYRIANDGIYVPCGVVHDIYAHTATRMFCVGREDF